MAEFVVTFMFEKSTKNTHRYKEAVPVEGVTPIIGTLYVQRVAFSGTPPEDIRVTVEYAS